MLSGGGLFRGKVQVAGPLAQLLRERLAPRVAAQQGKAVAIAPLELCFQSLIVRTSDRRIGGDGRKLRDRGNRPFLGLDLLKWPTCAAERSSSARPSAPKSSLLLFDRCRASERVATGRTRKSRLSSGRDQSLDRVAPQSSNAVHFALRESAAGAIKAAPFALYDESLLFSPCDPGLRASELLGPCKRMWQPWQTVQLSLWRQEYRVSQ